MNPNLVFASILTEQTRYSATERWFMKKFLNSKAPFLFSMTSQSYGVGGIKSFTAEKISRDAVEYGYGDSFKGYVGKTGETFWKPILTKKYEEARFPTILIKNILTRWSNAGFSLEGKPGVVVTLYNFGNLEDKKPNASPKIGGAEIKLGSKTYYF